MHMVRSFLIPFLLLAAFVFGCVVYDLCVNLLDSGVWFFWDGKPSVAATSWVMTSLHAHDRLVCSILAMLGTALAMLSFALDGDVITTVSGD